MATRLLYVTDRFQRQQKPTRGETIQSCGRGNFGNRLLRRIGAKRFYHRQSAFQRLHDSNAPHLQALFDLGGRCLRDHRLSFF